MEIGGLVVGVVGVAALATLFHDCVESFDCFKAAHKDFEGLLVELDLEKARLLYWGHEVGILNAEGEGQATKLKEHGIADLIERALKNIKEILADADILQQRYGVRVSTADTAATTTGFKGRVSSNLKNMFDTSWTRFCIRSAGDQPVIKRLSRARWAIHDKGKFEALIIRLRTRVAGLSNVVPINKDLEDQIIQEDIASIMNISQLRLVESVCKGPYPRWADRAGTTIEATESGTVDRRNIEEWLKDNDEVIETAPVQTTQSKADTNKQIHLRPNNKLFFVLSGQCLNVQRNSTCDQDTLGSSVLSWRRKSDIDIFAFHGHKWSVGRRIARQINLKAIIGADDIDVVTDYRIRYQKAKSIDPQLEDFDEWKIAKVYIYCPPCACLVYAALDVGKDLGAVPELDIFIRVDDRLVASCCGTTARMNGISSLCQEVREMESVRSEPCFPELDRDWIEQRLFSLEEDICGPETDSQVDQLHRLLAPHSYDEDCAAVIILGEVDYCSQMMRHPSFPQSPRMPRETELYMISYQYPSWKRKYVGAYTPRHKEVPTTQPTQTSSSFNPATSASGTEPSQSAISNSQEATSPPHQSIETTQTSVPPSPRRSTPPTSPDAKRQRTSAALQDPEYLTDWRFDSNS